MGKKKKEEIEVILSEYTFVVNKKAKVEVHRDEYELEVSSMHGDADHYSTKTKFFKKEDEEDMKELFMWLSFFDHLKELGYPDRDTIEELIKLYFKEYNEELEEDEDYWDSDGIRDLISYDATTDNQYICRPSIIAVYYHDTYGVKQEVKFKKK